MHVHMCVRVCVSMYVRKRETMSKAAERGFLSPINKLIGTVTTQVKNIHNFFFFPCIMQPLAYL